MHNEADNERVQARIEKLVNRLPCMVYRCRVGEDYSMTLEYVSAGSEALLGIPAPLMVEKKWNTIERMTLPADIKVLRIRVNDALFELYALKATPTMYLLDKGNVVVLKEATKEQLATGFTR